MMDEQQPGAAPDPEPREQESVDASAPSEGSSTPGEGRGRPKAAPDPSPEGESGKGGKQRSRRRGPKGPPVVAGVRFKRAGRIYYFDARRDPELSVGDRVIVDTAQGTEAGDVVIAPGQVLQTKLGRLKPIRRRATQQDLDGMVRLREREPDALAEAAAQIKKHRLPMRAVAAEYSFDGSRLTVYFTSDKKRVDFRALVRDLARSQRTRVLLRQVGPRDKAKLLGGIDRCGRELCCSSWMPEFQPISIRMAKTQGLPLNPSEISGVCGKLLCCLAFEDEQYRDMRTGMPKPGAKLTSAVGRGRVVDVNLLTRKVTVAWEDGSRVVVDGDEFADQRERWKRAFGEGQEGDPAAVKSSAREGDSARGRGGRSRSGGGRGSSRSKRGRKPKGEAALSPGEENPAVTTPDAGRPASSDSGEQRGESKPKKGRGRRGRRRRKRPAERSGGEGESRPKAEGERPKRRRRRRRRRPEGDRGSDPSRGGGKGPGGGKGQGRDDGST